METNERGQVLLNLERALEEHLPERYERYNGGWIKAVEGLDKTKTNGFSIVDPFIEDGTQWVEPGLYVDCSIGGSRKNQRKSYTLFRVREDGRIEQLNTSSGRDWAVDLWPAIEAGLGAPKPSRVKVLAGEIARLSEEERAELSNLLEGDQS